MRCVHGAVDCLVRVWRAFRVGLPGSGVATVVTAINIVTTAHSPTEVLAMGGGAQSQPRRVLVINMNIVAPSLQDFRRVHARGGAVVWREEKVRIAGRRRSRERVLSLMHTGGRGVRQRRGVRARQGSVGVDEASKRKLFAEFT